MSDIAIKRMQQAIFGAAAAANRDYGSGSGTGQRGLISLGSFSGTALGAYSTANQSTWTDITGTSFSFQAPRAMFFFYLVSAECETTSGVNVCLLRGNIVGFDTTFTLYYAGQGPFPGMTWYYPVTKGPIQPGTYTCKLQAATDAGDTITVDRATHEFFMLGF